MIHLIVTLPQTGTPAAGPWEKMSFIKLCYYRPRPLEETLQSLSPLLLALVIYTHYIQI